MKVEVACVSIDPEIKDVLDNHKETLEDHSKSIAQLQIDNATIKTQMNDIKETISDFKNIYLQTATSMMGTLSAVFQNTTNNNTEIIKTKSNNSKEIVLKILAICGGLVTGYFALKGVGVNI